MCRKPYSLNTVTTRLDFIVIDRLEEIFISVSCKRIQAFAFSFKSFGIKKSEKTCALTDDKKLM
jgi:hypothetical protein